jgi:hypothetical protein
MAALTPEPLSSPSTSISALLITTDRRLVRELSGFLNRLDVPVRLADVAPGDSVALFSPDVVFVDAEVGPVVVKSARVRYPQAIQVAIVGHWSETEVEVQGFADWTLHKPLRSPEFNALHRLFRPALERWSA